jgi:acyl-CoA thioester hydrolase
MVASHHGLGYGGKVLEVYQSILEMEVRDYECDMSSIVNNAVYQHYLEHARHMFLKSRGVDYAELAQRGIHLVVIRIEIDYVHPLRSGDKFFVGINTERVSRLRFGFKQDIYRLPDNQLILRAKVVGTAVNEKGRPKLPKELETLIGK